MLTQTTQMMGNSSSISEDEESIPRDEQTACVDAIDKSLILHYSIIPSIILILILSFLERQKKRTRINDQSNPLHGLFGFVVPLDLIGAFNNRWTYGFAFGSIANTIIVLFDEGFLPAGVPGWAKGFVILAGALEVGLCYFPIFACLTTANKIVGPIIGFLYTLFWLSVTVADIVICPHETAKRQYEKIISHWPSILCFLFLLYRFVYTFICRNKPGEGGYKDQNLILQAHQAEHVRRLLRKPVEKHKSWFERNIYTWDPCFKFPNRIIGTTVLALFCLYILITQEFNGLKMIIQMLKSIHTETFRQFIQDFANAIHGVWYFATILSSLTTVSYIFHILACYRKHMKRLWAGNKAFLPVKFHNPASSTCIVSIARYSSWQVAYILWGYMIMNFVQACFGLIFVYLIVYPIRDGEFWILLSAILQVMIPFGTVYLLVAFQTLVATKFFLQNKISNDDKQKPLALNNRKAFQNFSYFFFFYHVIVGLGHCLSRVLKSLVLGSWLIARIDRTILPKGFEALDSGYRTWIGMLYMDHYHNNPVLVSFCHVLLQTRAEEEWTDPTEYAPIINTTEHQMPERAKTKWFLFYTLLRNPSIIKYRKKKNSEDCSL